MADEDAAPKRPRADVERNRERLLDAAHATFARDGAAASLEEIARTAGVGIGTLYRHFPTRDALVEAVYRQAIGQLSDAAADCVARHPPVEALRRWMLLFIDYLATKKLMAAALSRLVGGTTELYATSGERLQAAIALLTDRAVGAGAIRFTGDPLDLLRAIAGVAQAGPRADWEPGARRMVDILIAGLMIEDAPR